VREHVHHPATARELTRTLRIPREEVSAFKRQLKALVASGDLLRVRGNRYGLPDKMDLIVGRLSVNAGGFGFVVPEGVDSAAGRSQDLYIPAGQLSEAMHGDRVVARIERHTEKGIEGRIIRVLDRAHATVVGRFEAGDPGLSYVVPFDRRLIADVHVPSGQSSSAESGDMVVVEITRWPTATRGPAGRVIEVLGRIIEQARIFTERTFDDFFDRLVFPFGAFGQVVAGVHIGGMMFVMMEFECLA